VDIHDFSSIMRSIMVV